MYDTILFLLQREYAGMGKELEDIDQNWAVKVVIFGRWEWEQFFFFFLAHWYFFTAIKKMYYFCTEKIS